jgi:ribonuclease R
VHVSLMNDDYYQFDERAHTLTGANTGKAYRLGDQVEVQVVKVDLEQRKIDFSLTDVIARAASGGPRTDERPRRGEGKTGRPRASAARPAPRKTRGTPSKRRSR